MKKKPHIVAIIQARMGSTRLPGKTLMDICGKSLLERVIERTKASKTIDTIVVATTNLSEDQKILDLAIKLKVKTYAGSKNDVLDRFFQAALQEKADIIVRVTADDPFKDPQVIDRIVKEFLNISRIDYVSNVIEPTYPEGIDIEVFSFSALKQAQKEAILAPEREHVTPYFLKNPNKFKIKNVKNNRNLRHLRWTLDYPEDLQFAHEIYKRLSYKHLFLMKDILKLLEKEPNLIKINQQKKYAAN